MLENIYVLYVETLYILIYIKNIYVLYVETLYILIYIGNICVLSMETLYILMENNIYNGIHICELYVEYGCKYGALHTYAYHIIVENLRYKLEIYV